MEKGNKRITYDNIRMWSQPSILINHARIVVDLCFSFCFTSLIREKAGLNWFVKTLLCRYGNSLSPLCLYREISNNVYHSVNKMQVERERERLRPFFNIVRTFKSCIVSEKETGVNDFYLTKRMRSRNINKSTLFNYCRVTCIYWLKVCTFTAGLLRIMF